jgi:hypothetical protein
MYPTFVYLFYLRCCISFGLIAIHRHDVEPDHCRLWTLRVSTSENLVLLFYLVDASVCVLFGCVPELLGWIGWLRMKIFVLTHAVSKNVLLVSCAVVLIPVCIWLSCCPCKYPSRYALTAQYDASWIDSLGGYRSCWGWWIQGEYRKQGQSSDMRIAGKWKH